MSQGCEILKLSKTSSHYTALRQNQAEQSRDELQEEISHLTPTEPGKSNYKKSEPTVNNCFNFYRHMGDELIFHLTLLAWI